MIPGRRFTCLRFLHIPLLVHASIMRFWLTRPHFASSGYGWSTSDLNAPGILQLRAVESNYRQNDIEAIVCHTSSSGAECRCQETSPNKLRVCCSAIGVIITCTWTEGYARVFHRTISEIQPVGTRMLSLSLSP